MLCQTLSHTLKLAPHERPSTQPLTKNPQQLCYFLRQTLTKDPQQVWQTLKNFDYPSSKVLSIILYLIQFWDVYSYIHLLLFYFDSSVHILKLQKYLNILIIPAQILNLLHSLPNVPQTNVVKYVV